jgi:hypothetical protein
MLAAFVSDEKQIVMVSNAITTNPKFLFIWFPPFSHSQFFFAIIMTDVFILLTCKDRFPPFLFNLNKYIQIIQMLSYPLF